MKKSILIIAMSLICVSAFSQSISIVGTKDTVQLSVKSFSSQGLSTPLILVSKSDGTEYFRLSSNYPTNLFAGFRSGEFTRPDSGGVDNSFYGSGAGFYNRKGSLGTFIGKRAGEGNTDGVANTFIGAGAGQQNDLGGYNTFSGYHCGVQSKGSNNSMYGADAGANSVYANSLAFFGRSAGYLNTLGNSLTFLGAGSNPTLTLHDELGGSPSIIMHTEIVGSDTLILTGQPIPRFVAPYSGRMWFDTTNVGIGLIATTDTKLYIQGVDSTSSNYSLKIDNSASSQLFYVRNDGKISMSLLPTSNSGLSTGDLYVDTAANILSNGDKIVGYKV